MERKAAQQNKNLSEELKQGLPRHSSGKRGRGRNSDIPPATECDPLPPIETIRKCAKEKDESE